jgi:hypothetical protein
LFWVALDEHARQPARDRANNQPNNESFDCHDCPPRVAPTHVGDFPARDQTERES